MKHTKKPKKTAVEILDLDERVVREWKYLRKIYIKDEDHLLFASFIIVLVGLIVCSRFLLRVESLKSKK